MPQLVAHFLSFSGRSIDVGDATLRLGSRFRLVVDGEALRSTFGVKGAAGTRPCPHCRNVVLREAYMPNETFATISEHRTASFRPTQDASLWRSCERAAATLTRKKDIDLWERSSGINLQLSAIFFQPAQRGHLLLTDTSHDVMHLYFAGGCASWELAMLLHALQGQWPSALSTIHSHAAQDGWARAGQARRPTEAAWRNLFLEKLWEGDVYKADASETFALVPLVHYYTETLYRAEATCVAELDSFAALAAVTRELRRLRRRPYEITTIAQTQDLRTLQERHHRLYVAAYGPDACKPKHHWRHHLPESIVMLGQVPWANILESKHRMYKSGGVGNNVAGAINRPEVNGKNILAHLLQRTCQTADARGTRVAELVNPTDMTDCVDRAARNALGLQGAQSSRALVFRACTLREGDVFEHARGAGMTWAKSDKLGVAQHMPVHAATEIDVAVWTKRHQGFFVALG
eukprot:g1146.t1